MFDLFQATPFAFFGVFLLGVSIVLWWLLLRESSSLNFPILSVLALPTKQKKIFSFKKPPWWMFICFFLLAALLIFASFQPHQKIALESVKNDTDPVHLWIVDLSPSVSSVVNLDQYKQRLALEAKNISQVGGRIDVIRSDELSPSVKSTIQDLSVDDIDMKFHKAGFQLVSLLAHLGEDLKAYQSITVFTDGDAYSLDGMNMAVALHSLNLGMVLLEGKENQENIFIRSIKNHSLSNPYVMGGDEVTYPLQITLQRVYPSFRGVSSKKQLSASGGKIKVISSEDVAVIGSDEWDYMFAKGESSLTIPLTLNVSSSRSTAERFVSFEVLSGSEDSLELDNRYIWNLDQKDNILLVGSLLGENVLADPLRGVSTALRSLGYWVDRWDKFPEDSSLVDDYLLVILDVSFAFDHSSSCGSFSESLKGQKEAQSFSKKPIDLWLIPSLPLSSYSQMCGCLQSLLSVAQETLSCTDKDSPAAMATILEDHGFYALTYEDSNDDSGETSYVLWQKEWPAKAGRSVALGSLFVSLLPFDPFYASDSDPSTQDNISSPISHGTLPFLIRDMLELTFPSKDRLSTKNPSKLEGGIVEFLRSFQPSSFLYTSLRKDALLSLRRGFFDITEMLNTFVDSANDDTTMALQNVALSESLLIKHTPDSLSSMDKLDQGLSASTALGKAISRINDRYYKDAQVIIYWVFILLVSVIILEFLFEIVSLFYQRKKTHTSRSV
ncbi:MAG: BatA domain-containing protein [Proteobacteria bacterium]|nr:BatA domain-containing protein [Pseudomonadota bacterium]